MPPPKINIPSGAPQIQVPPMRMPPAGKFDYVNENFRKWQKQQDEWRKNVTVYTRDVPKGPDPKESSRTFSRWVNAAITVVLVVAGIGGLFFGANLYTRWRRPLTPEQLARSDPWIRGELQASAATNASAKPPEAKPASSM
jgi:hypothetical protein